MPYRGGVELNHPLEELSGFPKQSLVGYLTSVSVRDPCGIQFSFGELMKPPWVCPQSVSCIFEKAMGSTRIL